MALVAPNIESKYMANVIRTLVEAISNITNSSITAAEEKNNANQESLKPSSDLNNLAQEDSQNGINQKSQSL